MDEEQSGFKMDTTSGGNLETERVDDQINVKDATKTRFGIEKIQRLLGSFDVHGPWDGGPVTT